MFLTRDQLAELTGYKLPSLQRRWLEKNGIPHHVNAAGRPVFCALRWRSWNEIF